MVINYYGHSYFLIEGKEYSIALDPFKNVGLHEQQVTADYVFCSHEHYDHNNVSLVKNAKRVKSGGNFKIVKGCHDNAGGTLRGSNDILIFCLDGKKLCFFGDEGETFNEEIIKECKGVDVLFIPVGGTYTIDAKEAVKFATAISAKITVPMHYRTKRSNIDIAPIGEFLRKMAGVERVANSIEITEDTLPYEPCVYAFDDEKF